MYAPLGEANRASLEWVEGKLEGGRRSGGIATHGVTPPTDPTGRDWVSAVALMADADEYTDEELASLSWTWREMQALGYTAEEFAAMNPPVKGAVRFMGGREWDMSLGAPYLLPASAREALGTL